MSKKKKVLFYLGGIVVVGGLVLYNVDFGGDMVAQKAAQYVASQYDMGVAVQGVKGNPFRGYTLSGIDLTRNSVSLLQAGSLFVKPNLFRIVTGNVALSWVELRDVKSSFDQLRHLAEVVTKVSMPPLPDFLPKGPVELKSLGGSLDGSQVRGEMDVVVSGFPVKGSARASLGAITNFESVHLDMAGGTVDFSGQAMPTIDMTVKVKGVDLGELGAIVPQLASGVARGRVSGEVKLGGTPAAPTATGTVSFDDGAIAGVPLSLTAQTTYGGDKLSAEPLNVVLSGVPMSGHVKMDFGGTRAMTDIALASQGPVGVDVLRRYLPQLPADASGQVDQAYLSLRGPLAAPQGSARVAAARLSAGGAVVTDTAIQADFDASGLVKLQGRSTFAGAPMDVRGSLSLLTNPSMNLSASVKGLNLAAVKAFAPAMSDVEGSLDGQVKAAGPLFSPDVAGTVVSPSLSVAGVTATRLNVPFVWKSGALTLNKATALVYGAPLAASGIVNVFGGTLDLTVSANGLTVGNFRGLVPDLPDVKGGANVTARITGPFNGPRVDLSAASDALSMPSLTAKELKVNTAMVLKGAMPSELDLQMGAGRIVAAGFAVDSVTGRVHYDGQTVALSNFQGKAGGGVLTASGTVGLKDMALSIKAAMAGGDLAALTRTLAPGMVSGTASADATVGGTASAPQLAVTFSSPRVTASGMAFEGLSGRLDGTLDKMTLSDAKANFGGAALALGGTLDLRTLADGDFNLAASGVNLATAFVGLADTSSLGLAGTAKADLSGTITKGVYAGKGNISVAGLKLAGFTFDDPASSIVLKGTTLSLPDLKSGFYGGHITAPVSLDFGTMGFKVTADASGVDLAKTISAAMKGAPGGLTGTVKGHYEATGALVPFKLNGSGTLTSSGGEVVGFPWVGLVTRLYGEPNLRYASAKIPFGTSTTALTLQKGTEVTALEGDKLYRYLRAVGALSYAGDLDMNVTGNLNAMVINVLFGAGTGAIEGLALGSALGGQAALGGALAGLLTGGREGMKALDFRDLSFSLTGTIDSPSIRNFKIGPSSLKDRATGGATAEPSASPVEKAIPAEAERAIRDVLSGKSTPQSAESGSSSVKPEQSEKSKSPQDQLKDAVIKEGVKKLGDLFN